MNPQTLSLSATQSANDSTAITQFVLPISRLPTRQGRAIVMEMLYVNWNLNQLVFPGAGLTAVVTAVLTTVGTAFPVQFNAIKDPRTISAYRWQATTGTVAGFTPVEIDHTDDLTDRAGHGILVATDTIYLHLYSVNTGVTNDIAVKIAYRWKEVSLEEYIGIVQSQQAA